MLKCVKKLSGILREVVSKQTAGYGGGNLLVKSGRARSRIFFEG